MSTKFELSQEATRLNAAAIAEITSACQRPSPQPENASWPKYLRRCENCRGLLWRLKSGKWTHRKGEWRNER